MSDTKNKGCIVKVRVETNLKIEVSRILESLGLSMSGAIRLFLNQVVIHRGLPFEVKIPKGECPPLTSILLENPHIGSSLDELIKEDNKKQPIPNTNTFRKNGF